jgi:hypothetical protein
VEKAEWEQNKQPLLLPYGWKLYLQLAAKNNKWLDLIYLAKSTFANASIGAFTAKNFQKGGIIGFYIGEETWKAPTQGTEEPSEESKNHIELKKIYTACLQETVTLPYCQLYQNPSNNRSY